MPVLRTISFWDQVQERPGASDPPEGNSKDRHSRLQAFGVVGRSQERTKVGNPAGVL